MFSVVVVHSKLCYEDSIESPQNSVFFFWGGNLTKVVVINVCCKNC